LSSYASADFLQNAVGSLSSLLPSPSPRSRPVMDNGSLLMNKGWDMYDPLMARNRVWTAPGHAKAKRRTIRQRQFLAALAGPAGPRYKPFRSVQLTRKSPAKKRRAQSHKLRSRRR
jgi:hypothetical protein